MPGASEQQREATVYPEIIRHPVPIAAPRALDAELDEAARVALAVYLLMAGPLFLEGVEPDDPDRSVLPPERDLAAMNVHAGRARRRPPRALPPPSRTSASPPTTAELAAIVAEANETGDAEVAARAVALGTRSEDELIRVCALGSAVEFFDPADLDLPGHVAWVLHHAGQDQTRELMATLLSRVGRAPGAAAPASRRPFSAGPAPGLMAIHGTVLPGSRPVWSVPATGPLFVHLQAIRPDIYDRSDFFRWEGGYSDYAREVAAHSLASWQQARGLAGIDLVAHSHGCNVAMAAAGLGAAFGRMVLLSCPVHWAKYALNPIGPGVVSVRIHADAMILMDRGGQRFPPDTIPDVVLPLWYTGHGATNDTATWRREALDRFIT
jgi:hypothetical protein